MPSTGSLLDRVMNELDSPNQNDGTSVVPFTAGASPKKTNVQDLILSVLACSSHNTLQAECFTAVTQQIKRLQLQARTKRKSDEESTHYDSNKRLRTQQYQDDDDPFLAHATTCTTASGQNTSSELQQQKDAMIQWFSERLFQLETTFQAVLDDQAKSHHAQEIQQQQQPSASTTAGFDDYDLARTEAQYRALTKNGATAIEQTLYHRLKQAMKEDVMLLQCRHENERSMDRNTIAEWESKCKDATKIAEQLSLKLNQSDEFERKNRNLSNLVEQLSAKLVQLEQQQQQQHQPPTELERQNRELVNLAEQLSSKVVRLEQQQSPELERKNRDLTNLVEQLSSKVVELEQQQQQSPELERKNWDLTNLVQQLSSKVAPLEQRARQAEEKIDRQHVARERLQKECNARVMQVEDKARALQQLNYALQRQNNDLQRQNQQFQQQNEMQYPTTNTTWVQEQQAGVAHEIQQRLDDALQADREAREVLHREEISKLIKDRLKLEKCNHQRMEGLADMIKNLSAKNRHYSGELHAMAMQVNPLRQQVERLKALLEQERRAAGR